MRVLVTGGAGLVGSTLIATAPDGVEVHATQRHAPVVGAAAHTIDLADPDEPVGLLAAIRPDVVIHTAYGTADLERDVIAATRSVAAACAIQGAALDPPEQRRRLRRRARPLRRGRPARPGPRLRPGQGARPRPTSSPPCPDAAIVPHLAGVRRRPAGPAIGLGGRHPAGGRADHPLHRRDPLPGPGRRPGPHAVGPRRPAPGRAGRRLAPGRSGRPQPPRARRRSWPRPTASTRRGITAASSRDQPDPRPRDLTLTAERAAACPLGLGRSARSGRRAGGPTPRQPRGRGVGPTVVGGGLSLRGRRMSPGRDHVLVLAPDSRRYDDRNRAPEAEHPGWRVPFRHGGWRNRPKGVADPGGSSRPHVVASVSVAQPDDRRAGFRHGREVGTR